MVVRRGTVDGDKNTSFGLEPIASWLTRLRTEGFRSTFTSALTALAVAAATDEDLTR